MKKLKTRIVERIVISSILIGSTLAGCTKIFESEANWTTVYQDDYNYARSVAKFNTWFWREDSVGTHTFNVTNVPAAGCTASTPCVKLTSEIDQTATDYINAEMYNNSCAATPIGEQRADRPLPKCQPSLPCLTAGSGDSAAGKGGWFGYPIGCYACYAHYCSKPYPYRPEQSPPPTPAGVTNSWNTGATGAVALWKNPLYAIDAEPNWEWYRDLVFNVPYKADANLAQNITMGITSEGQAGGSRGWGYWNTTMSPSAIQLAWFMEVSTQNSSGGDVQGNVWLMTIGDAPGTRDGGICVSMLSPLINIYSYHNYAIEWQADAVTYYVDGQPVAQHTAYVPNRGLSFHNWADNRNYVTGTPANYPLFTAKTNYINSYVVQEANNPPRVTALPGDSPTCVSFAQIEQDIEKGIEKDIMAAIIAWMIEHSLMPGPVIPPGK